MKPSTVLKYMNTRSNHCECNQAHPQRGLNVESQEIYPQMKFLIIRKKDYEKALKEEGHITNLVFTLHVRPEHKSRSRDAIWYKPAFNLQLKTKIGKIFKRLDKHFSKNSLLAKVFNRNMVKLSYSCTGNLQNVIMSPKILEMERGGRGEKKKSKQLSIGWGSAAQKVSFTLLRSVIITVSRI